MPPARGSRGSWPASPPVWSRWISRGMTAPRSSMSSSPRCSGGTWQRSWPGMTTNGATPAASPILRSTWGERGLVKNRAVRILVIDDDAVACEFLQEALLRSGYEVDTFTSARAALEEELSRYDMLLSDIRMPD